MKECKRRSTKVAQMLALPPGPNDLARQMAVYNAAQKTKKKKHHEAASQYGFDSYVQDHAIHSFWPILIEYDRKSLRQSVHFDPVSNTEQIDYYKANDAVQNVIKKIDEVIEWAKYQTEEYNSIVDILVDTEAEMPSVAYSSRGTQNRCGDPDDDDDEDGDGNG